LPLGVLREGWSSIRQEHVVIIMLAPGEEKPRPDDLGLISSRSILYASRSEPEFVDADGHPVNGYDMQGGKALLVCGIARPDAFEATCLKAGIDAVVSVRFDDHHWYSHTDMKHLQTRMAFHGCRHLVTTEKDVHKLPPDLKQASVVVRTGLQLEGADGLWHTLETSLEE
jgi:tetraacyldisaccharide-1-P 4'-kinase